MLFLTDIFSLQFIKIYYLIVADKSASTVKFIRFREIMQHDDKSKERSNMLQIIVKKLNILDEHYHYSKNNLQILEIIYC